MNNANKPTVMSAVLLAAGESVRMLKQKALLPWNGTTLIESQVLSLLGAGVTEIVVVLGYRARMLSNLVDGLPNVKTIRNPRYRTGKSSSVKAGLRHIDPKADGILILAVDQPRSVSTIRPIIDVYRKAGTPIVYPSHNGKGGHPIIFATSLLPEMLGVTESTMGLRGVVERYKSEVTKFEMNTAEILLDLNLPDDYERAKAAYQNPHEIGMSINECLT